MEKKVNWVPAVVLYCVSSAANLADYVFDLLLLLNLAGDMETADALVGFLGPLDPLALIFAALLLFRCWKALPEAHRKTTPGKAVGFLFIPLFNFYWVFVSFPALAKGYYSYGKQVNAPEIKDMSGLGIAYAVVFVLVWVVFLTPAPGAVTFVTTIADVVVFVLFFKAMSTYANRALSRGASAPPPAPSSAW